MTQTKGDEEAQKSLEVDDEGGVSKSEVQLDSNMKSADDPKPSDGDSENSLLSPSHEDIIKMKYGGLLPKKRPLISKGHDHAYFDSADWELRKQNAQKSKGQLEELRPKLQPTPHHQLGSRRSAYDPPHYAEGCKDSDNVCALDEEKSSVNDGTDNDDNPSDQRDGDSTSALEDKGKFSG